MRIRKNDKGNAVADVQQRLVALGYELGPTGVDGFFGKWTEKAVRGFQGDREVTVTGIVNEETWRRMVDATYNLGDRALYLRSPFFHGDDVRQLQLWLNGIGFRTEFIDGIFGPSTEAAVKEFQDNLDLSADGIVGPSTVVELNNIRGMLDQNQASLLGAELPLSSVVSLLQDRKISVGCATPHKRQWLDPRGSGQLLCADLSHRLSNLLEVLGADIDFFRLHPNPQISGDIAVVFRFDAEQVPKDCVAIGFDHADESSRKLAELVSAALRNSLKRRVEDIVFCPGEPYGPPTVEVLPGHISYLIESEGLRADVFKQKIAGAVFDGLKAFFELSRMEESV